MELINNPKSTLDHHTIVLFDGVCKLCNGFIRFYHLRRINDDIRYLPLDSKEAAHYINDKAILRDLDTVIVLKNGKSFTQAAAIIELIKDTKFPWKLLSFVALLPSGVLNTLYAFVAKHRYKIFGKTDQCAVNYKE